MTVMTFPIFEAQTAKSGFALRARGKNLDKVDAALKAYHNQGRRAPVTGRVALLCDLVSACERWLKSKAVASGLGSQLYQRRRIVIHNLGQQALTVLLELDGSLLAQVAFSRHKIDMLGGGRVRPETQALGGGYANERTHYLALNKKSCPISGTAIAEEHRNLGNGHALKNKRFDELSYADFHKIAERGTRKVDFLTREERQEFIAIPQAGRLLNARGDRIDAITDGADPYVMDEYGSFFMKLDRASTKQRVTQFNHSSFNAGKSVVCAGGCRIVDGQLVWLDNDSGHYKPGKRHLHNLVRLLAQDGVDLSRTAVVHHDFSSGSEKLHLYQAINFLKDIDYAGAFPLKDEAHADAVMARAGSRTLW